MKNELTKKEESIHEKILALKNEIEMKFIKLGGYLKLEYYFYIFMLQYRI